MAVQSAIRTAKKKENVNGVVERDIAVEKVGLKMGVMVLLEEKTVIIVHFQVKKGSIQI